MKAWSHTDVSARETRQVKKNDVRGNDRKRPRPYEDIAQLDQLHTYDPDQDDDAIAEFDAIPSSKFEKNANPHTANRKENEFGAVSRSSLRAAALAAEFAANPKYAGRVITMQNGATTEKDRENANRKGKRPVPVREMEENSEEEEEYATEDSNQEEEDEDDNSEIDDEKENSEEGEEEEEDFTDTHVASRKSKQTLASTEDIDAALEALEHADALEITKSRTGAGNDASKGRSVRTQLLMFESFLETRMRLQHALVASTQLPPETIAASLSKKSPAVTEAYNGLRKQLRDLLHSLLQIRHSCLMAIPEVRTAVVNQSDSDVVGANGSILLPPSVKLLHGRMEDSDNEIHDDIDEDTDAELQQLWSALDAGWNAFASYRDTTIDSWGSKLSFVGGLTAKRAAKLKVLNAPISAQVATLMSDPERVAERIRPAAQRARQQQQQSQQKVQTSNDTSASRVLGTNTIVLNTDEIYDDTDFFTQLLRDTTGSTTSTVLRAAPNQNRAVMSATALLASLGESTGMQASAFHSSSIVNHEGADFVHSLKAGYAHTSRPDVDRKASKARRLKYVVHPKLVGFVAPAPYVVPPDMVFDLDAVVASLFHSSV